LPGYWEIGLLSVGVAAWEQQDQDSRLAQRAGLLHLQCWYRCAASNAGNDRWHECATSVARGRLAWLDRSDDALGNFCAITQQGRSLAAGRITLLFGQLRAVQGCTAIFSGRKLLKKQWMAFSTDR